VPSTALVNLGEKFRREAREIGRRLVVKEKGVGAGETFSRKGRE